MNIMLENNCRDNGNNYCYLDDEAYKKKKTKIEFEAVSYNI